MLKKLNSKPSKQVERPPPAPPIRITRRLSSRCRAKQVNERGNLPICTQMRARYGVGGGLRVIYLLQASMKYHTGMRETAATQVPIRFSTFCLNISIIGESNATTATGRPTGASLEETPAARGTTDSLHAICARRDLGVVGCGGGVWGQGGGALHTSFHSARWRVQ